MKEIYFPIPNRRHIRIHAFINIYKYTIIESSMLDTSKEKISEFYSRENIGIENPLTKAELSAKIFEVIEKFNLYAAFSHEERTTTKLLENFDINVRKIFRAYNANIFAQQNKAKNDIQTLRTNVNKAIVSILSFIIFVHKTVQDPNEKNSANTNLLFFKDPKVQKIITKLQKDENYSRLCIAYNTLWHDEIEMQYTLEKLSFYHENKLDNILKTSEEKILNKICKHLLINEVDFTACLMNLEYWDLMQEMVIYGLKNIQTYLVQNTEDIDYKTYINKYVFGSDSSIDSFYSKLVENFFINRKNIEKIIDEILDKWALERLSLVDKTLIMLGFIELKYFTEIPHQVSINEYIEIGKIYGGEKSSIFINGILDKLK